ncbi:response regulator [Flavihumibacter sp. R14]|nr:response regulator [Flavihumibacter soli]
MEINNERSNLNVLVVDDDEVVLFLHDLMVRESGLSLSPHIFATGKSALEFLKDNYSEAENYLIFLDINMPVMNGWQFLELIEKLGYKISVIIVSSSIDPADFEKAKSYGLVKEYIIKPLSIDTCVRIKKSYIINDRRD